MPRVQVSMTMRKKSGRLPSRTAIEFVTRSPRAKKFVFRENYRRQGPDRNRLLERDSEELQKLISKLEKLLNKD